MNIYDELVKDHQELKEMLEKAIKKPDDISILKSIEEELSVHSIAEEKVFYSPLKKKFPNLALALEGGVEEHDMAMRHLKLFHQLDMDKEEKQQSFLLLRRTILTHIEKEENEIFDLAKKSYSNEEAKEIGQKFKQEKEKIKQTIPQEEQCELEEAS